MTRTLSAIASILFTVVFSGCGGGRTTSVANTNSPPPSSQATIADPTPLIVSIKDLGDKDATALKALVGRTLVFKTEIIKNWDEGSLTASYLSRTVICKGDFSQYKDAIKSFQAGNEIIYGDFKGVVDLIDDAGSGISITLKGCTLTKLER